MSESTYPLDIAAAPAELTAGTRWKALYRMGAISALIMAGVVLIQMAVFIIWPPPADVLGWFRLFQAHPLLGLLDLDLVLLVDSLLMIPVYLALFAALFKQDRSWMALGIVLGMISVTLSFASNPSFTLLNLSGQYAAAASDAQRSIIQSAGLTLMNMWTGTGWVFYYILGSLAPVIMCAVMLRDRRFSPLTACMGIIANVVAFVIFIPVIGPYLSLISVVMLEVWFVLLGLRLLSLN